MIRIAKSAARGNFLGNLSNLGNPSSDGNSGTGGLARVEGGFELGLKDD